MVTALICLGYISFLGERSRGYTLERPLESRATLPINKPALPRGHAPPGRPGGHIMSAHGAHRARRATPSGREHPPYVWNGSPVPMCVGYACVTYPGRYSAARISPSTAPPARGPRRRAAPPPRIKVKIDILKNKGATFTSALLVCAPHTRYGPQTLLGAWVCRI